MVSKPKQTLVQSAANGRSEPIAEVSKSCRVRSQREECCECEELYAATQRENRSFK